MTTFLYLDKLASGSNLAVITAGFLYTFLKKIQIIKNNPKNKKLPRKSQSFGEHSPKKRSKLHGNMSTKKNRSYDRSGSVKKKVRLKQTVSMVSALVLGATTVIPAYTVSAASQRGIGLNPEIRYQTLKGWGTSLCWWGNSIGSWGDADFNGNETADREEIAELAFSPEYLNLNIVRYNVGGGDKEDTSIKRCEGIVPGWTEDMTGTRDGSGAFDPDTFYAKETEDMADAGQLWMLEQANAWRQESGDIINEVFSNSPPYYMTKSGSSTGGNSWELNNLKDDQYDDFALYLTRAARWIDRNLEDKYGTGVTYIEPLNEPDTSYWQNGSTKQEGCIFNTGELQSKAYREMANALEAEGLSDIQITGTDETSLWNAINSFKRMDDDVKEKMTTIGAHTYSGNDSERKELKRLAQQYEKDLWMSEVTKGGGAHYDGCHDSMDAVNARSQSEGIMADLKYMQPTAWIAWLVADSEYECLQTNSNWGLLHAVFEKDGPVPDYHTNLVNWDGSKKDWVPGVGYWAVTKQFYTMMQYSKYLKAGYTMIDIEDGNMCAAVSPDGTEVVIVAQNFGGDRTATVDLSKVPGATEAQVYRTSDSESCELVETLDVADGVLNMNLPWNSVSTFVLRSADGSAVCEIENTSKTVDADVVKGAEWVSETDKFSYNGSWGESSDEFGGGKYSTEDTADVTFTFEGTQAALYGTKDTNGATVQVKVDGQDKGEASLFAVEKTGDALLYYTGMLEDGQHTVTLSKVEGQGNKLIEMNFARVIEGTFDEEQASQEKLLYFVDCNSPDSPVYQKYSKSTELCNDTSDQAYTEGSWGYLDEYGEYNGNADDQYDTGWYAKSGQKIQYTFPLKAGTYKAGFGFKEWWNESRPMKISVTKDGVTEELGTSDTWKNGNNWNKDVYEFTCETDGEVTLTVEKAGGADPVLSFLEISGSAMQQKPEVTVDKTGIQMAMDMADALAQKQAEEACFTEESWATVQEALDAAKQIKDSSDATQEQVDEAFMNLLTACNGLANSVQRTGLAAAIEGAKNLLTSEAISDYTQESIAAVETAITEAEAVYGNPDAEQEAVNAATTRLLTAVTQLAAEKTENPDTRLEILIQAAKEILAKEAQYTPVSIQALKDALEQAKEIAAQEQADKEQVERAYQNLAKAMTGLVRKANKDELANALEKAGEILKNPEKYVETSIAGLQAATEEAQAIYENQEADTASVSSALQKLIQEVLKARLIGDVNGDGQIDTSDVVKLLRNSAEIETLAQEEAEAGDVTADGETDLYDAAEILQYVAESIDSSR